MNDRFFFTHFRYIDPIFGKIQENFSMMISDKKITQIGPNDANPQHYPQIDLKDAFITPGLINIHCHLTASGRKVPSFFLQHDRLTKFFGNRKLIQLLLTRVMYKTAIEALSHGVTTVRSLGDVSWKILQFRNRIEQGFCLGPRIFCAGKGITTKDGHGSIFNLTVENKNDAVKLTHDLIAKGVDVIKLMATGGVTDAKTLNDAGKPQLSVDIMETICKIAHEKGKKVAAHCESKEGVWNCIQAGVDSIEHGADYDTAQQKEMIKKHIAVVPTLSAPHTYAIHTMAETGLSTVAMENSKRIQQLINAGIQQVKDSEIIIGAGTDAGIPMMRHSDFALEMVLLQKIHDFTPIQTLQCATINNARILGEESRLGSLEPGKWADFLVFTQNPLENLKLFKNPDAVYKNGSLIPRIMKSKL